MSTHNIGFYGEQTKMIVQLIVIKYPAYLFSVEQMFIQ